MITKDFDPWKNFNDFDPTKFMGQSSELKQWPIKLWKAPIVSPYYHRVHLLIAADCSAFACPNFHSAYACGKVTLTCCAESDFDIMTKLSRILLHNDVKSVTVVKTDKSCCADLTAIVIHAAKSSRFPIPIQSTTIFIDAEEVGEQQ